MTREKVIKELAGQFMARTKLCEASWADKIEEMLVEAMELCYGAAYDHGRTEVQYRKARKVLQMNDYGTVLAEYKSVNQAAEAVGGDEANIRAVLNSRQHRAYGHQWRYADTFYYNKEGDPENEEDIS